MNNGRLSEIIFFFSTERHASEYNILRLANFGYNGRPDAGRAVAGRSCEKSFLIKVSLFSGGFSSATAHFILPELWE